MRCWPEAPSTARTDLLTDLLKFRVGETAVDPGKVEEGLLSGYPSCREQAIFLAGRDPARFAPTLIRAWTAFPHDRPGIIAALRGDPLLRLPRRRHLRESPPAPTPVRPSLRVWLLPERFGAILDATAAALEAAESSDLLLNLPGLHQLAAEWDAPGLIPAVRERLRQQWEAAEAQRFAPQIMIAPSWNCSRGCAFCFVSDRDRSRVMSTREFAEVLDRIAPPGELTRVNLFGGEPTELPNLIELAGEMAHRGLRFSLPTNALCDPGWFATVLGIPNLEHVTVHIDHPASYSGPERERLTANLRALASRRTAAVFRYNLTGAETDSWEALDAFLDILPQAPLSFAVAFPSCSRDNQHVPLRDLSRLAGTIGALVRHVDRSWPQRPLVLSKPFPLCAFTEADLREILARVDVRNICELDRQGFRDQLLVGPDGTMSPCMALGGEEYRLAEVRDRNAAARHFAERLAPLIRRALDRQCRDCALFECGMCQAACYAYAGETDADPPEEIATT